MKQSNMYDSDFVQELLDWANKCLENKIYPSGEFALNDCTTITDCKFYIQSMIAVISKNWENPTFNPTIHQLCLFREKIENNS